MLELHYNPMIGPPMNWARLHHPGMRYLQPSNFSGARQDRFAIMQPHLADRTFPAGVQPYVKLHGSVNWVESNVGSRILVMGGMKAVSINRFPILTWYHDEFRKTLLRPDARLMVIGYGFGDAHINDAIANGLNAGLKLFVVDPHALDVIKKDLRIGGRRKQIIGLSTKPLTETFGGNRYAHSELSKFFT